MNDSSMSDMIRQMMQQGKRKDRSKDMPEKMFLGQYASTIRQERAPDGSMREYIWLNPENEDNYFDDPDSEWESNPGSIKIYGNWNEYAQGQDENGVMYLPDDQFPYRQLDNGEYVLDEAVKEGTMQDPEFNEYQEGRDAGEDIGMGRSRGSRSEGLGGPGASPMEDLMQRLSDRKKMMRGGKIYSKGGKFPDLNKDGKVTLADILKGRGVIR